MEFIIVTGLSGAGKTQAVRCLEDMGFYCVDNMPPPLIDEFLRLSTTKNHELKKAAFVIDIRGGEFFQDLKSSIENMKKHDYDFKVMFIEASDQILVRRYKESRRLHPLNQEGKIIDGIRKEREALEPIRKMSDYIIDTSQKKAVDLRNTITEILLPDASPNVMNINFISFGYKFGIPIDADFVFDLRFIPNPFYLSSMKKRSGNDKRVQDYVLKWPETQFFIKQTEETLLYLLPKFLKEGKSELTIAFGCTGGHHRSVTLANYFYKLMQEKELHVTLTHRDL